MSDLAPSPQAIDRRTVLRGAVSAVAAAPSIVPAAVLAGSASVSPSEKITLGVVGCGPRGQYDLKRFLALDGVRCVMIADVQASRREEGRRLVNEHYGDRGCVVTRDYRELLLREDIDAVLIATGDRWHGDATIQAVRAGKDVYCEKPCGLTIDLCQRVDEAVREAGAVYQAGTQRRSIACFQRAATAARGGELGQLTGLYASVYEPSYRTGWLPAEPTPDPEVVDWDAWLGPAPWRPYNAKYPRGDWRGRWDFDAGVRVLEWGAHTLDLCQWAAQADDSLPIRYEPTDTHIECRYASGLPVILDYLPDPFGKREPKFTTRLGTCPVRFEGDLGAVETGDSGEVIFTGDLADRSLPKPKERAGLDVLAHARDFIECVKSREAPVCNSVVMRRSHVACHAAALAWLLGRTLRIDPSTETFIDDAEANGLRRRPARSTWSA